MAGHKINIQKFVVFLYTNNALSAREKNVIPLIIALKRSYTTFKWDARMVQHLQINQCDTSH